MAQFKIYKEFIAHYNVSYMIKKVTQKEDIISHLLFLYFEDIIYYYDI